MIHTGRRPMSAQAHVSIGVGVCGSCIIVLQQSITHCTLQIQYTFLPGEGGGF